jgi:hypothetical protein
MIRNVHDATDAQLSNGSGKWILRAALIALLLLLPFIGIGTSTTGADSSPIALDGMGTNSCPGQFCEQSQMLTTTQSNDMIVLIVETYGNTTISHITDSNGLSFTQHHSYTSTTSAVTLWDYYAVAPSALRSDNITVFPDQCCFRVWGMQVLAISGADTSMVFDHDTSTTAAFSCPGPECGICHADYNLNPGTCSATIQTSANNFVIATTAINDAPTCGGYLNSPAGYQAPPGFTRMTSQNNRFELDYAITTAPHGNVVFDCNGTDATAILLEVVPASSHA